LEVEDPNEADLLKPPFQQSIRHHQQPLITQQPQPQQQNTQQQDSLDSFHKVQEERRIRLEQLRLNQPDLQEQIDKHLQQLTNQLINEQPNPPNQQPINQQPNPPNQQAINQQLNLPNQQPINQQPNQTLRKSSKN
jgi:hypothetical protein